MNAAHLRKLQIVVLAAGFSSRLGRPKALARVHGVSLLRRTLNVVSSFAADRIVVVVPRSAMSYRIAAQRVKVRWAVNPRRALGLSSSVRCGIAAGRYASAIMLLPADLIHLTGRDLLRLIQRWRAAPRCLVARRIDLSGATPAILPRWLYARAASLTGDVGLRHLIGELSADTRVLVDLPSASCDIDTAQDLRDARRRFRRPTG